MNGIQQGVIMNKYSLLLLIIFIFGCDDSPRWEEVCTKSHQETVSNFCGFKWDMTWGCNMKLPLTKVENICDETDIKCVGNGECIIPYPKLNKE
jgi:hypothetical protein